jgi:transcriptional accessory protein Tex/SPT6
MIVALNIVTYRDEHGRFRSRKELNKVPGIGAKTYEQAAGLESLVALIRSVLAVSSTIPW